MGQRPDEQQLRRRAIEGVRHEVEAFGCAAGESKLIRRGGLVAAVVPASPQRSVFNSVPPPGGLEAGAPLYERLGFRNLGFVEMWELRR